MADTTFVPGTPVVSAWLNDVNAAAYRASSLVPGGSTTRTAVSKFSDFVSVKDYPNVLGDGVNDDSVGFQAAIDALYALGGGSLHVPQGVYLCNTPLVLKYGVNLIGEGRDRTTIRKNSTTTKTVTTSGTVLVGGYSGALPTDMNAVIILDGPGNRYVGSIIGVCIEGTYSDNLDYESQKAEFGIVSTGSVSDFKLSNCYIRYVKYGTVLPVVFVSRITDNRYTQCLNGLFINNGTSTFISNNYINGGRDYGFYIRDLKYSLFSGNACDFLNDPSKYPTRSRTCAAYTFRSCLGLSVRSNGDENTWGRSLVFNEFDRSECIGHTSISLGSDYTGADQIAWIYSTAIMRGSTIKNNFAYAVKTDGLIYGGASSGSHHNIYFEGLTFVDEVEFDNNLVASVRGSTVEAGWGNNVPTTWINATKGRQLIYTHSPEFEAQVAGDLSVVYGSDNMHYIEQKGNIIKIWGCFHVTPTFTTASGRLVINNFPANGSTVAAIDVIGVGGGSGLANKLGWFEMSAASTGGVGNTDDDGNFNITHLTSGSTYKIHYHGTYSLD